MLANRAAEACFKAGNIVLSRDGVIFAANATADRMLKDAFAAAERGDEGLGLRGIEVVLATGLDRKHVAHPRIFPSGRCHVPPLYADNCRKAQGRRFQKVAEIKDFPWWAHKGSNLGPLPCEGNALPLSYAPGMSSGGRSRFDAAIYEAGVPVSSSG